jgi:hypothetical protein
MIVGYSVCPPVEAAPMTNRWWMRRAPRTKALRWLAATCFAFAIVACSAAPPMGTPVVAEPPVPTIVRVIVRFKPAVPDPLDPAFLTRLATQTRVMRIDPIRPMSGDAYVLQMACVDPQAAPTADPCTTALARLREADAVLYVDVDRREKHQ